MTCPGCVKKDEAIREILHLADQKILVPLTKWQAALDSGRAALSAPAPDLVAVPRELLERMSESLRQGHNTLADWSRCPCNFDSPCPHAAAERELAAVLGRRG